MESKESDGKRINEYKVKRLEVGKEADCVASSSGFFNETIICKTRHYTADSYMPIEEDRYHEFKNHRTIAIEEAPKCAVKKGGTKLERSRQPVSKTINAFLNSATGGTIYLGVQDGGQVKGLKLTLFQVDHVVLSLAEVLSRFRPPVPWGLVTAQFVPVLDDDEEIGTEEVMEHLRAEGEDERRLERSHLLGSREECWCDVDSQARSTHGILPMSFLIEIYVKAWDGDFGANAPHAPTSPLYENEEGLCYFRRTGSNWQPDIQDILNMKAEEARRYLAEKANAQGKIKKVSDEFEKTTENST